MNDQQRLTLKKWRSRYKRAELAHSCTANRFELFHLIFGILLIALTTASCVLIFASNICPSWISPVVGIAAALMAYLQTFLQFREKADLHRDVARRYSSLKKQIEYIIDFNSDNTDLSKLVDDIRVKADEIAIDSPNANGDCWEAAKKETQQENDQTSIRNRVS